MVMNQQASMERLRVLYHEKDEHLEKSLETATLYEFYREIFPVGAFERKGNYSDSCDYGWTVGGLGYGFYHHVPAVLFRTSAVRKKCPVFLCHGFRSGRGGYAPAPGHAAPDEQGYSSLGNLCCKHRDKASPVLCA